MTKGREEVKKYRMVFILCLFFSFFCPFVVCAIELVSAKEGLVVLFVIWNIYGLQKETD